MSHEVIAQEQEQRRLMEEAPTYPYNSEEMEKASFVSSIAPDLHEEILLTEG